MPRYSEKKRKEIRDGFTRIIHKFGGDLGVNANTKKIERDPNLKGADQGRRLKKKKRNLKNALDVHWRTDAEGYESIMRQIYDESKGQDTLSDAERKRWFKPGWQKRLSQRRFVHRKQGIMDAIFMHPSIKAK